MRTLHFNHNEKRRVLRAVIGLLNESVQFAIAPEARGWALSYPVPPAPVEQPSP